MYVFKKYRFLLKNTGLWASKYRFVFPEVGMSALGSVGGVQPNNFIFLAERFFKLVIGSGPFYLLQMCYVVTIILI